MSRLRERYEKEVTAALSKEFGYKNVMAIPKIQKVVVNMGLGEATQNAKIADTGADEIARIRVALEKAGLLGQPRRAAAE